MPPANEPNVPIEDTGISEGSVVIPTSEYERNKRETNKRLDDLHSLVIIGFVIALLTVVGILVTVIGLVEEQIRYDNATFQQQPTLTTLQSQVEKLQGEVQAQK